MADEKNAIRPTRPIYKIRKRNKRIELGKEKVLFTVDGISEDIEAHVFIKTQPSTSLFMEFETTIDQSKLSSAFQDRGEFQIHLRRASDEPEYIFTNLKRGQSSRVIVSPSTQRLSVGVFDDVREVRFHILNFIDFWAQGFPYKRRNGGWIRGDILLFEFQGYLISINSLRETSEIIKSLDREGGEAITHAGKITKKDGTALKESELENILSALYSFLSFAMGSRSAPFLPVGFDSNGKRVWELWGANKIDPWGSQISWFDSHHGNTLIEAFKGFISKWNDPAWHETIQSVIYWYAISNRRFAGVDGSLILAQAALELLSWVYVVEYQKNISGQGFKSLSAADKLSMLISQCKISLNIPDEFKNLKSFAKSFNCENGPQVTTSIRNALVHMDSKTSGKRNKLSGVTYHEALMLSLWYIELSLLNIFGFTGEYSNRFKPRWRGEVEKVPWA